MSIFVFGEEGVPPQGHALYLSNGFGKGGSFVVFIPEDICDLRPCLAFCPS